MADKKKKEWVDNRHPGYDEGVRKRSFARDQYTGDVYDITVEQARGIASADRVVAKSDIQESDGVRIMRIGGVPNKSATYLVRRAQGESGLAFYERAQITRFPNHMTALVDSYVGGAMAVERKAEREWGDILGDPNEQGTPMYGLWRDIDGTGINWNNSIVRSAKDLIVDDLVVEYVDVDDDGRPRVERIEPDNILNMREEGGRVVELLLYTPTYEVTSLMDENGGVWVNYYTLFDLDGWKKFVEVVDEQKKREIRLVDEAPYKRPIFTDETRTKRRLPFNFARLGLDRYVGYQMAVDHNQLYNLLSDGRWNFRMINFPKLTGRVEDKQWMASMQALMEGMNALQGDWSYISPDSNNGTAATQLYQREVQSYYIVNHQRMNGVAIERSATEIAFSEAAGRTSFLTILVGGMDEVENGRLFLLSQMLAPDRPGEWNDASITRSRDFRPIDMISEIQSQSTNFAALAAAGVPLPIAAKIVTEGFTAELIEELPDEVKQEVAFADPSQMTEEDESDGLPT